MQTICTLDKSYRTKLLQETAANKQEYKEKNVYFLKKKERLSAMSFYSCYFLMLAYRHEFVLQRLRSILKLNSGLLITTIMKNEVIKCFWNIVWYSLMLKPPTNFKWLKKKKELVTQRLNLYENDKTGSLNFC